ncbi:MULTISPECIES: hypothetical protein [Pseudomonas]|uniref:hypothetical protein n=1 Tax=Pseudomonas TaxID=286 RepID=UPI0005AA69BD|nr:MULTISPECIES: hypothetical protein [Pseudomonas]AZD93080.1 hypothetical protein C4K13_3663 [Pseudomonas chlororaphis subsp. aureofaciens]KAB0532762.1 hypothetical protein F7R16_10985 [Pseudomonas chlororaphis subsp. aureofaciens]TSD26050.1 hypothetical protein FCE86_031805 [Pseudomonas sp. ATCC 13985]WDG57881.1 hypothetical protein PUP52_18715 [Pseudomonas chlororaphis]WDG64094.1 hypothetical protein PUP59_18720 [Pseudomonas chlororaphis]
MSDKMREEFEAWHRSVVKGSPPHDKYNSGDYRNQHVQRYWIGWQASREALVVELPPAHAEPEEPEFAIDDSHMDAYRSAVRMRDGCVKAIEAQGLKVKA